MNDPNPDQQKQGLSLTTKIVIGLLAGVLCGLFFGEYTIWVKWIGDAFVGLLQMAVLPYVALSLIASIGGLSVRSSVRLLRVSVMVLMLLWGIGLLALIILAQSFPQWDSGSFFSSQFTEVLEKPNWLDLFIPSNPFRSLSENSIPAVVVFCIGLGIALMTLPDKQKVLEPLGILIKALSRLNKMVVRLTPLGMFGIVAYTTGTTDPGKFILMQGYLLTYGAASLVLSFFVIPAVIATLTPLSFGEIWRASRDALITAFVIGNTFVVLPMIIDAVDQLMSGHRSSELGAEAEHADYLVALGYPFPDVGRIVGLIFIPFAAWFYGQVLEPATLPALLGVGILGSFGKPVITLPLMLDIAKLPGDIFNLWLASGVLAARFGDLMKTMHLIAFTLLTVAFLKGVVQFHPLRILVGTAISIAVLVVVTLSIRVYLESEFKDHYSRESLITERSMVFPESERQVRDTPHTILDQSAPHPLPIQAGQSHVERIREYGSIRVGFEADRLPFAYFKESDQQLTGLDIQMAFYLASDLGVSIEFVPIRLEKLAMYLLEDHIDIAMSAIEGTVEDATVLPSLKPYMFVNLAVVTLDHDAGKFKDTKSMLSIPNLKIAYIDHGFFAERARRVFPDHVEVVPLRSAAEYFEGRYRDVHGLVISAEAGSAWTLRFPAFSVTNPVHSRVQVPLYYRTIADPKFESFLDNWLTLKQSNGTFTDLYDYWILGKAIEKTKPRWCILRNVLRWVE